MYITPTPEYDRLSHSEKNTLQLNNGIYDRSTQNYTGYNTDMFNVHQPDGVVEEGYHHVPMDWSFQDNSDYKGNNKITELRTILQMESQNS